MCNCSSLCADAYEFSIVLHYDNHMANSLGYGISWQCLEHRDGETDYVDAAKDAGEADGASADDAYLHGNALLATCSFYDHCLQIWTTPCVG